MKLFLARADLRFFFSAAATGRFVCRAASVVRAVSYCCSCRWNVVFLEFWLVHMCIWARTSERKQKSTKKKHQKKNTPTHTHTQTNKIRSRIYLHSQCNDNVCSSGWSDWSVCKNVFQSSGCMRTRSCGDGGGLGAPIVTSEPCTCPVIMDECSFKGCADCLASDEVWLLLVCCSRFPLVTVSLQLLFYLRRLASHVILRRVCSCAAP